MNTKSKRTSFDLLINNAMLLELQSKKTGSNYSNIINNMIKILFQMDPSVKKELESFFDHKISDLQTLIDQTCGFEKANLENQKKTYENLLMLIANRAAASIVPDGYKKIEIKHGTLVYPGEWILLNDNAALDSPFVGVVEIREPLDHSKLYNMPHFIYFSRKNINELTESECDQIFNQCARVYPLFEHVLNNIVRPEYSGNVHLLKYMLNLENYKSSPVPGIFQVGSSPSNPYGCYIDHK